MRGRGRVFVIYDTTPVRICKRAQAYSSRNLKLHAAAKRVMINAEGMESMSVMRKKVAGLFCACLCLTALAGCFSPRAKQQDAKLTAQMPYTFSGTSGDWSAVIVLRPATEADFALLVDTEDASAISQEVFLQGYRSVVRLQYKGTAPLTSCTYTFAGGTDWAHGGTLQAKESSGTLNAALDGQQDLGGIYYSQDMKAGGPLPPTDQAFTCTVEARAQDGTALEASIPLTVSSNP